jgi:hypothetical protein
MHIYLAHHAATELTWGSIYNNLGSYYLGATAPDIRAMTKWPRERTHFAPLSVESVGTGVRTMFELHPELADNRRLSPVTRAFLLGYSSHLTADEVWITTMFRPHFDNHNLITDSEVEAHIWDRALQLDMDRKARLEMDDLRQASEVMSGMEPGVEVAFLPPDLLLQWREWVARFMSWDFNWDRLKRALNRVYRDNEAVQQVVDRFLQDMPGSLERIYQKIPEEKLVTYQQGVLAETVAQVREYFGEA